MAEDEYKGIKIGGSKLLLIIPLLGTIGAGLWGGFELFTRYQAMEKKINSYTAPDLTGFDKRLAVLSKQMVVVIESVMVVVCDPSTLLTMTSVAVPVDALVVVPDVIVFESTPSPASE